MHGKLLTDSPCVLGKKHAIKYVDMLYDCVSSLLTDHIILSDNNTLLYASPTQYTYPYTYIHLHYRVLCIDTGTKHTVIVC